MKIRIKTTKSLAYIFVWLFALGFQGIGWVEATDVNNLSQNLTTVEKQISQFYNKIRKLKQEVRPTLDQVKKLKRENNKITEVLNRNIRTGSSFPWINLSQPQKSEFNASNVSTIAREFGQIQDNINRLASQLSDFSRTVAEVETHNQNLRTQYRQAKEDHKKKQELAQKKQRKQNWQKVTDFVEQVSSPENIPLFQGKQYSTWKEYWNAKNEWEQMNSK